MAEYDPICKQKPAGHTTQAAIVVANAPPSEYLPGEQAAPAAVISVSTATVCCTLNVYAPAVPTLPANAVMVVPTATPGPKITCPAAIMPVVSELSTMSVVPEMVPLKEMARVPAAQNAPMGQALADEDGVVQ